MNTNNPKTMTMQVEYINPPIPIRNHDWCAYWLPDHEDNDPCGWGQTPEDAVYALLASTPITHNPD